MTSFVRVLQDIALLLTRVAFGAILVLHGWRRWQGEGGIGGQVADLAAQGWPYPTVFGWAITMVELVGGVLLVFGALTPLVGAAITAAFVLTALWSDWGTAPLLQNAALEHSVIAAGLALVLTVCGAGRASIDGLFRRPTESDHDDLEFDRS